MRIGSMGTTILFLLPLSSSALRLTSLCPPLHHTAVPFLCLPQLSCRNDLQADEVLTCLRGPTLPVCMKQPITCKTFIFSPVFSAGHRFSHLAHSSRSLLFMLLDYCFSFSSSKYLPYLPLCMVDFSISGKTFTSILRVFGTAQLLLALDYLAQI